MSETQQPPVTDLAAISQENVNSLVAYLNRAREAAVTDLQTITTITNDEEYAAAESILAKAKQLYDVMSTKRKAWTDPIKKFIAERIMPYENVINPAATEPNEYLRARKVLEDYNQAKIKAKQLAEHNAKVAADLIKYKAEFKAQVQQALAGKLAGLHKNAIQNFVNWEKALTLDNFDTKVNALRSSQPALKPEYYDECFKRWGAKPEVMGGPHEDEYLLELKKELPYETYNQKFQELIAPIKNDYLSRIENIHAKLIEISQADKARQEQLTFQQEQQRKAREEEDLLAANKKNEAELQSIQDTKEMGQLEGDFTQQAMTADMDAGPSKQVASFTNDAMWLPPFLKIVSKVAVHPKFKGIVNAKGEYIPEVKKFLEFYGSYIAEPIEGITFEEKAKTIVRKK